MIFMNKNKYDFWISKKLSEGYSLNDISNNIDTFLKQDPKNIMKKKSISKKVYEERKKFLLQCKKIIDHDYKLIAGIKVKRKYF